MIPREEIKQNSRVGLILWRSSPPLKWISWGETKQQQSETMFCLYSENRFFGETGFWNAIYKPLLKGSERPRRLNAASEKWYSLEPGEEVRRDEPRTWTWKSATACVCVWDRGRQGGKGETHAGFFNQKVSESTNEFDQNLKSLQLVKAKMCEGAAAAIHYSQLIPHLGAKNLDLAPVQRWFTQ